MRVLEIFLVVLNVLLLFAPFLAARFKNRSLYLSGLNGIVFILHALLEGLRWQMSLCYFITALYAVIALVTFLKSRHKENIEKKVRKRIALRVLACLLLVLTVAASVILPVFALPQPTGHYAVGRMTFDFTDKTRPETYSAQADDYRELMVTLWYPCEKNAGGKPAPYAADAQKIASAAGVPGFLLDYFTLAGIHARENVPPSSEKGKYPLLLFSHGIGTTGAMYTSVLEELASQGYMVASIDHTYGTLATVFPDGKVTPFLAKVEKLPDIRDTEAIWVQDIQFVLDKMEELNSGSAPNPFQGKIDLSAVGALGHSFGGAASYSACCADGRIRAGADMDGSVYADAVLQNKPFLIMVTDESAQSMQSEQKAADYSALTQEQRNELTAQGVSEQKYNDLLAVSEKSKQVMNSILQNGGQMISYKNTKHYDFTDSVFYSPITPLLTINGTNNPFTINRQISAELVRFFNASLL